jgi:SRSO17 transposase
VDQAVAVGHSVEAAGWTAEADRLLDRMAGRFARVETRRRARAFVLGLLADLPRKNCWTIAEHAGDPDPHGMQHLLARASWDTDGVRDDLRDYVVGALGDSDGILVVDLCRHRDYAEGLGCAAVISVMTSVFLVAAGAVSA